MESKEYLKAIAQVNAALGGAAQAIKAHEDALTALLKEPLDGEQKGIILEARGRLHNVNDAIVFGFYRSQDASDLAVAIQQLTEAENWWAQIPAALLGRIMQRVKKAA